MGESELIGMIRDVNAQYAVLFGQIITINFAMIVAIYYFLHRSALLFRIAAFGFYAIGMLALVGLMLEQSNVKNQALIALRGLPAAKRTPVTDSLLAINQSWLAQATSFFLNVSIWVLFAVVAYLLFWWRGDPERRLS
ncbi:MAG: hypothetical protein ACJ8FT_05215 [Sphingomonas sp.]